MEERKRGAITRRKEGNVNGTNQDTNGNVNGTGKDISRLQTLPSSPAALLPPCVSIVIIDRVRVWACQISWAGCYLRTSALWASPLLPSSPSHPACSSLPRLLFAVLNFRSSDSC